MSTRRSESLPSNGDKRPSSFADNDDKQRLIKGESSTITTNEKKNIDLSNSKAESPKGVSSNDPPEKLVASVSIPMINEDEVTGAASTDKQETLTFSSLNFRIMSESSQDNKALQQLERDAEIQLKSNLNHLRNVLNRKNMECDGLETLDLLKGQTLTYETAEKVVGWALIHHAMENPEAEVDANTRIVLAPSSILGGIGILIASQDDLKSLKYFSDGEKYVRAAFSLARKIAPCVIFVDEVDLLGQRSNSEHHDAMSRIKNELMSNWDVLRGKEFERVVVLAATDRPFDLDEALIRRLPI